MPPSEAPLSAKPYRRIASLSRVTPNALIGALIFRARRQNRVKGDDVSRRLKKVRDHDYVRRPGVPLRRGSGSIASGGPGWFPASAAHARPGPEAKPSRFRTHRGSNDMATDAASQIADAYRWQRRLGNADIPAAHCHIVANPAHPDVWDANHADNVTARTGRRSRPSWPQWTVISAIRRGGWSIPINSRLTPSWRALPSTASRNVRLRSK